MGNTVLSREKLCDDHFIRTFSNSDEQVAFPLGGIGTGNVSIGARGELKDWEIFNRPGKGVSLPYTFFALRTQVDGDKPVVRVLEGRLNPPYHASGGLYPSTLAGLPRMGETRFKGEYPICFVDYIDSKVPLQINLQAYTPFIPLNPQDSGIPTAIFKFRLTNTSSRRVNVTLVGSIFNAVGFDAGSLGQNVNVYRREDGFSGLYFSSEQFDGDELPFGNMTFVTTSSSTTVKTAWLRSGWFDTLQDFWDDFTQDGLLTDNTYDNPSSDGQSDVGSLGVVYTLEPGEHEEALFILSWYFPNRPYAWSSTCECDGGCEITQNYYATMFSDSWDVTGYVLDNFERLQNDTFRFHDAFFSSTLPGYVLDAVSSQMGIIRSTTCMWFADGRFFGWEGCHGRQGCCHGTCTHVWNYAQSLAFLFPSLEQEMRKINFLYQTDESGGMAFRTNLPLGKDFWEGRAADGQMGTIMRLYREWKLSGDNDFLRELWPKAKLAMEYAWEHWDQDQDGVMEGSQHNTYDINFEGPNSMMTSFYLGALKACAEMARAMGDEVSARKYQDLFERGRRRVEELLWNGEYYVQRIDDVDAYKYQYGTGCLSDQVIGQWFARIVGLGDLFDKEHVKTALRSIFIYNFLDDFSEHSNCQRTYVLNDEKGLLLCSWPHGGRPRFPFPYSDEAWTGIEYQVASHMIYEGLVDEGLTIVKAARERFDGIKRNPWNEYECGNHYARAMSSWALLTALSGFSFDMTKNEFSFDPKINRENFKCFWITGKAWGTYTRMETDEGVRESVDILYEKK